MNFLVEQNVSRILLGEEDVYDEATGSYTIPEFEYLRLIGSREHMIQMRQGLNALTDDQKLQMEEAGRRGREFGTRFRLASDKLSNK